MRTMTAARVFFLILAALAGGATAHAQDFGSSIKIERLVFPVSLSSGPADVVGYLYYHGSYQNRPLQVLVHGATYNHAYWDFPTVNGVDYSYARYMAAQKYAVLAIDLPGAGESDKPAGAGLGDHPGHPAAVVSARRRIPSRAVLLAVRQHISRN